MLRKLIIAAGVTTALGNQSFLQEQRSAEKGNKDNTANVEEKKDKCCGSGKKEEEKKEEPKKEEEKKDEKKEKPAEGELASFVQKPDGCQSCGGTENKPKNQNGTNGEKPDAEPAKPNVAPTDASAPKPKPDAQPTKPETKTRGKPSTGTHHLRGNSKDAHVSDFSKAAKVGSQVHEAAVSTAAGYYQAAKQKVSTALQSAQDNLYGAKETVHSHIKSHPVTSAAVAAAGSTAALTAYYGGAEQLGAAALSSAGGLSSMASSALSSAAGALSSGASTAASMGGAMLAKVSGLMPAL